MAAAQARRTHCPRGHAYDEANTCISNGRRHCLTCSRDRYRQKAPIPKARAAKILDKIDLRGEDECWPWLGAVGSHGYGIYGRPRVLAHRWAYEHFVGPIPVGLVIDHLCMEKTCVNPAHMEPVTIGENVRRGAASRRGGDAR